MKRRVLVTGAGGVAGVDFVKALSVRAYWECQNPECFVMKVYSRLNPRRLEVVKAHAL